VPDLNFRVEGAEPVAYSAAPLLALRLAIEDAEEQDVRSVSLLCQIRIETARRHYNPAEQRRLFDLFGEPACWNQTLRSLLWTHSAVTVPPFRGRTTVDLPVPCTFDLTVATARFFNGLEDGNVPLTLLFSGTIFYEPEGGGLQATQIPWSKEAAYSLPVSAWKRMMDAHYPNLAWLCLRRDVFDRLDRYRSGSGIPTLEQALERLLP